MSTQHSMLKLGKPVDLGPVRDAIIRPRVVEELSTDPFDFAVNLVKQCNAWGVVSVEGFREHGDGATFFGEIPTPSLREIIDRHTRRRPAPHSTCGARDCRRRPRFDDFKWVWNFGTPQKGQFLLLDLAQIAFLLGEILVSPEVRR